MSGNGSAAKKKLGRGLSSLLNQTVAVSVPIQAGPSVVEQPAAEAEADPGGGGGVVVRAVAVGGVRASPFQPRRVFDQGALERLAASIKIAGVMQPILVRVVAGADGHELVAGERRWRAAKIAGLETIPAVVAELSDEQAAEWSLIENVQREELGAMERAYALKALVERFGLSHTQAADKIGLDRSTVSNLLRLTELEPPVREMLETSRLTPGHGKALLMLPPGPARESLARRASHGAWSVRKTERIIAEMMLQSPEKVLRGAVPTNAADVERQLNEQARKLAREELQRQLSVHLGTKVEIRTSRKGTRGRIVVQFFDLDHFDGVLAKMGFAGS